MHARVYNGRIGVPRSTAEVRYERKRRIGSAHLVDECNVSANGLDAIVNIERFASDVGKRCRFRCTGHKGRTTASRSQDNLARCRRVEATNKDNLYSKYCPISLLSLFVTKSYRTMCKISSTVSYISSQ